MTAVTQPMSPPMRGRSSRSAFWTAYPFLLLPYLIPLITLLGLSLGGWWNFLTPVAVFGLVPLLDMIVGEDPHNPHPDRLKELGEIKLFRWITWAYVPVHLLVVFGGAWVASHFGLTAVEWAGFALSAGLVTGGLGINFAHELGHKTTKWEQVLAQIVLVTVSYGHFFIEHNLGHHTRVATRFDPASSRLGESVYRFYFRSVVGSYLSAWELENKRLEKKGLSRFSWRNRMIFYTLLPILIAVFLGATMGPLAGAFFVIQSVVAFSLLEVINYIEHYGLERRQTGDAQFERVSPLHSWNSNHRLTNGFLLMLQRHSDHHANPQRRYQTLRHFDESPQLPSGYAGMVVLVMVPPLWRSVMDPRVVNFRARLADSVELGVGR